MRVNGLLRINNIFHGDFSGNKEHYCIIGNGGVIDNIRACMVGQKRINLSAINEANF